MAFCRTVSLTKIPSYLRTFQRLNCTMSSISPSVRDFNFPKASPNLSFYLDPKNHSVVIENLTKRLEIEPKEAEDIINDLQAVQKELSLDPSNTQKEELVLKLSKKLPNLTHPDVLKLDAPKILIPHQPWSLEEGAVRNFDEISRIIGGARWQNTSRVATDRSYYLIGPFAELEQALIRYAVNFLVDNHEFSLVSVPDLLHPDILRGCGMEVDGERTQVFQLDPNLHPPTALSGTAEMAFGGLFLNKVLAFPDPENRVKKFVAVSRCYRAESTSNKSEKGIYRVHHFTKVEMFAVTWPDVELSNEVHHQFLELQKELFGNLELSFRVLDMPPNDLGAPAYRKFDIEALLPGQKSEEADGFDDTCFGEISSTSSCTDYQSRRLNIRTDDGNFVHTVNGTACAVPRLIMAICEQRQMANGHVSLPSKLHPFFPHLSTPGVIEPKPKKTRPVIRSVQSQKEIAAKNMR